ncbi:MAG: Ig-like domain-containing protein, partial [Cyclobacteriaceae bacterium]|nr:Ig-like domain-containing protein [Cyclobacteriaceae bacterium]
SDGDGITDALEVGLQDADGDGRIDDFADADGDGLSDIVDQNSGGTSPVLANSDGTGFVNYLDVDSDDDGIVDNIEGQPSQSYVAPLGTDTDGDGIDDAFDPDQGGIIITVSDFEQDGIPDYLDSDSDNDGILDRIEGMDANKDGIADYVFTGIDTDGDGLDDGYEVTVISPYDPLGSKAATQNTDGLDDRDWRDTDDDGDGINTIDEILNLNGNLIPDYMESLCVPGQMAVEVTGYAQFAIDDVGGTGNDNAALGSPDNSAAAIGRSKAFVLNFDEEVPAGATITLYLGAKTATCSASIETSLNNVAYSAVATYSAPTKIGAPPATFEEVSFVALTSIKYVRITVSSIDIVYVDAIKFFYYDCAQPVLASDDEESVFKNETRTLSVIGNDLDLVGNGLSVSIVSGPSSGAKATVNPDGTIEYEAFLGYTGIDSFSYQVCNTNGSCDTGTVTVSVSASSCLDSEIPIILQSQDTIYAISSISCELNGSSGADCSKSLGVPDNLVPTQMQGDKPNDHTILDFGRRVKNGSKINAYFSTWDAGAVVKVRVSNDLVTWTDYEIFTQPVLALYNFPAQSFNSFKVSIQPTIDFRYIHFRTGHFTGAKLKLDGVEAIFDGYIQTGCERVTALDDSESVYKNETRNLLVQGNDEDALGLALVTTIVSQPVNGGTAVVKGDGTIDYTPLVDYIGIDSFTYQVCNEKGKCDNATVNLNVLPSTCVSGEVPIVVQGLGSRYSVGSIECELNGSAAGVCTNALGEPDNLETVQMQGDKPNDHIILDFGQEMKYGSVVNAYFVGWDVGAILKIRVSNDLVSWTDYVIFNTVPVLATYSFPSSSFSSYKASVTPDVNFRYVEMRPGHSTNKKLKLDGVETIYT